MRTALFGGAHSHHLGPVHPTPHGCHSRLASSRSLFKSVSLNGDDCVPGSWFRMESGPCVLYFWRIKIDDELHWCALLTPDPMRCDEMIGWGVRVLCFWA